MPRRWSLRSAFPPWQLPQPGQLAVVALCQQQTALRYRRSRDHRIRRPPRGTISAVPLHRRHARFHQNYAGDRLLRARDGAGSLLPTSAPSPAYRYLEARPEEHVRPLRQFERATS